MSGRDRVWLAVTAVVAVWVFGLMSTNASLPLLPGFLLVVMVAGACSRRTSDFVVAQLASLFSYGTLRAVIIVFGAALVIQVLPLELALLASGEVLAYVELLVAMSFVAGQVRLRAAVQWAKPAWTLLRRGPERRAARSRQRTVRKGGLRRPPPEPDRWAYA